MSALGSSKEFEVTPFGLRFVVFGTAASGGSKRGFVNSKTGRVIITDDNAKAKPWKEQVASVAGSLMSGRELFEGPLALAVRFYVPRPKGHFGRKGLLPSAPKFPAKKPDISKLIRPLEDSLTGIVWRDDAQIISQLGEKFWGEPARVEVQVWVRT